MRAALEGRIGRDLRTSVSINAPLLYVALPVIEDSHRIVGVLRLALPLSAVTAAYHDLHRVMLIGGLVALVVAFGIGIFVAGRVTHPIVEMQAIARRMSEGQFAVRAPVRSVDEIGALGRALNVMVATPARAARERGGGAGQGHRDPRRHGRGRHRGRRARGDLVDERAGPGDLRRRRWPGRGQALPGDRPQRGASRDLPREPRPGRRRAAARAAAAPPRRSNCCG